MAQQVQNPPVMHVTRATVQRVAKSRSRLSDWAQAQGGQAAGRDSNTYRRETSDGKIGGKGVCTS